MMLSFRKMFGSSAGKAGHRNGEEARLMIRRGFFYDKRLTPTVSMLCRAMSSGGSAMGKVPRMQYRGWTYCAAFSVGADGPASSGAGRPVRRVVAAI